MASVSLALALARIDQLFIAAAIAGILLITWRYRHDARMRQVQLLFFGVLVLLSTAALLVLHL